MNAGLALLYRLDRAYRHTVLYDHSREYLTSLVRERAANQNTGNLLRRGRGMGYHLM
jgi:hypothetical protein